MSRFYCSNTGADGRAGQAVGRNTEDDIGGLVVTVTEYKCSQVYNVRRDRVPPPPPYQTKLPAASVDIPKL